MQNLAKGFTFEDKVNLSVFYYHQEVKHIEFDPQRAERGGRIYEARCVICHAPNGKGEEGYARIAGQQRDYVIATLKRFRENARKGTNRDTLRSDVRMEQATQSLSDQDIVDLSHFLASLK